MIQTLRTYIKSGKFNFIFWLILVVLILPTLIPLISQVLLRFQQYGAATGLATVDGISIPSAEFERNYSNYLAMTHQFKQQYGEHADALLKQFGMDDRTKVQKQIVDDLVKRQALLNALKPFNLTLSDQLVTDKLNDQFFAQNYLADLIPPVVYQSGALNYDMLSLYLQKRGISDKEFTAAIKQALALAFFTDISQAATYVPETEVRKQYLIDDAQKKYRIVSAPLKQFLTQAEQTDVPEKDLRAFYAEHTEQFRVPEKRTGELWRFTPATYTITPLSDEELQRLYTKQRHMFIEKPEQRTVKHILMKIDPEEGIEGETRAHERAQSIADKLYQDPEQFDTLATEHSESSDKDKEITISRDSGNPVFERASFALTQDDDAISPVIKTTEGFEIIKFISRKDAEYKPFEEVKQRIQTEQQEQRFTKRFEADAKRLIRQINDMPELLDQFVSQATHETIGPVTEDDSNEAGALFSLSHVGSLGSSVSGATGYLIKLKNIKESYIPEFEAVKKEVRSAWNKQHAEKAARKAFDALKGKDKAAWETWAQTVKGSVTETDWVDRYERYTLANKHKLPFTIFLDLETANKTDVHLNDTTATLVQLIEIEPIDEAVFENKRAEISAQLFHKHRSELNTVLAETLVKHASVKVDDSIVQQAVRRASR